SPPLYSNSALSKVQCLQFIPSSVTAPLLVLSKWTSFQAVAVSRGFTMGGSYFPPPMNNSAAHTDCTAVDVWRPDRNRAPTHAPTTNDPTETAIMRMTPPTDPQR